MKTNVAVKSPSPRTHEGGVASRISKKEELKRTIMSCLLFENSFYEDGVSIADRVTSLAKEVKIEDAITIMKMASKEYKLRHAPLWLALALLQRDGLAPEDIAAVITRADSLAEILAMYWKDGKRPLSTSSGRPWILRSGCSANTPWRSMIEMGL